MSEIPSTFKRKRLVHAWTYRDAHSEPLGIVGRYDADGEKDVVPYFKRNGQGWAAGGPGEPRPLFGLDVLAANQGKPVFVVEGEKCAAALQSLGVLAITSPGGSNGAHKADWTVLEGRQRVFLLPDNDTPGFVYMQAVAAALKDLEAPPEVLVVDLPELPPKGDVVDWLQARCPGWDGFAPVPESDHKRLGSELAEVVKKARPVPVEWVSITDDEWPEPVPLPELRPPVPPFEKDLLPERLRPWLADIAERMQCPPEFPAVGAVVALASLVGRQVGIRPKRFDDWLVVPNLWGAIVGRPGIMKTPALEEPLKPLYRLKHSAFECYQMGLAEHKAAMAGHEAMIAAAKKALQKEAGKQVVHLEAWRNASGALGKQAEALREIEAGAPEEPALRRYLTNDTSHEKLGELLRDNPNGILVYRDELVSWLKGLDKDGREEARGFFLTGWNGTGSYTFDRIVRGTVHVEAVCVSLLGGIQPGPLSEYVWHATHGGAGNDGLLQRFQLLVWPDDPGGWRNVDRWPDTEAKNAAFEVFKRLNVIDAKEIGADVSDGVPFLRFSPEGQELFDEWRGELERVKLRSGEPEALEAHLAKFRSLAPSLALLFHLIDTGTGPASLQAAARAFDWCEFLEGHARRVYGAATIRGLDSAHALAAKIREGRVPADFTSRDVYLKGWARLDKEGTELALDVLGDCNWLRARTVPTGGRPSKVVSVNPRLGVSHG